MKNEISKALNIFFVAWMQVTLVAGNVVMVANSRWVLAFITSWGISFVWTLNVKRAAFGNWMDRIIYATGAAVGCSTGMIMGSLFLN